MNRSWYLAAAAVIVAVAVAVGVWAIDADDDSGVTDPPTTGSTNPAALEALDGAIVFAADASAGEALTDPIAYSRIELMPEPMDIYVSRAGEPTRQLVSSGAHERCPAFSPDGERLAYLSVLSDTPDDPDPEPPLDATLVVLRLDGTLDPSDPELLLPVPVATGYGVRPRLGYPCPQWSPDGSRLAHLVHPAELRVVTLDGQEQVVADAVSVTEYTSPFDWSPSGDAIAFLRDDGVWSATLDGRAPTLLWQLDGFPTAVSWSSRGELAVTAETEVAGHVVHVVDVDGSGRPVGSTLASWDVSASWSPDGRRLAFVGADRQMVLHDRDDGSTVLVSPPVVDDRRVSFKDVAWSPSGGQLVALAHAVDDGGDKQGGLRESRGMALLSLSTDGALIDVLTPWSWGFDWTNLDDVSSYPSG